MAWTSSDLAALEAAIKLGAKRVTYGEGTTRKEVEYHSLEEMLQLRELMRTDIGVAAGTRPARFSLAGYRGG